MSNISSLTQKAQQKQSELLSAIGQSLQSELESLEQTTKAACKSVESELENATKTAESFHKSLKTTLLSEDERADSAIKTVKSFQVKLDGELGSIEQLMAKRMARMASIFVGVVGLILALVVAAAIALTTYYIKPQELKAQLQQRMELEKSGRLAKLRQGTFIVIPDEADCTWKVDGKQACKLPE